MESCDKNIDTEQAPEGASQRFVATFERADGDIAYVTIVDQKGDMYYIELPLASLHTHDLAPGENFYWDLFPAETPDGQLREVITPIIEWRVLTPEEIKADRKRLEMIFCDE